MSLKKDEFIELISELIDNPDLKTNGISAYQSWFQNYVDDTDLWNVLMGYVFEKNVVAKKILLVTQNV